MRGVGYIGVVSQSSATEFYKLIKKTIEEQPEYEYEFHYSTEMNLDGSIQYTCMLVGRIV